MIEGISFEDQSLVAPSIDFCREKEMEMSRCLFDISVTGELTNDSVDFDDPLARFFFRCLFGFVCKSFKGCYLEFGCQIGG